MDKAIRDPMAGMPVPLEVEAAMPGGQCYKFLSNGVSELHFSSLTYFAPKGRAARTT
jgi:hypothetical protein